VWYALDSVGLMTSNSVISVAEIPGPVRLLPD
jgi:hypothetical protein